MGNPLRPRCSAMVLTPTEDPEELEKDKPIHVLDSQDIKLLTTFGVGPYAETIKNVEASIVKISKSVDDARGIKESDTGLAPPSTWDLVADKQVMQQENPLQVARCTKIINADTENAQYMINVKQIAKFVVALGDNVSPMDIEEGMRVGVDRSGKNQMSHTTTSEAQKSRSTSCARWLNFQCYIQNA